jgi:hypothetical protein
MQQQALMRRSVSWLPQWGQGTVSVVEASSSKLSPHFLHWNSYMGIAVSPKTVHCSFRRASLNFHEGKAPEKQRDALNYFASGLSWSGMF